MVTKQPDRFPNQEAGGKNRTALAVEEPPADFIDRIRGELDATLRVVREARRLPWRNLTLATLAELRFHSIAKWLPDEEAEVLRSAFDSEMSRLYDRQDLGEPLSDG